jgi:hypothetical protein
VPMAPWMRWRFGERVCVVCGDPPAGSIDFPPPWLTRHELHPRGLLWEVPVCLRHRRTTTWPVRVVLALEDEQASVSIGDGDRSELLGLWDWAASRADPPPPTRAVKGPSSAEPTAGRPPLTVRPARPITLVRPAALGPPVPDISRLPQPAPSTGGGFAALGRRRSHGG